MDPKATTEEEGAETNAQEAAPEAKEEGNGGFETERRGYEAAPDTPEYKAALAEVEKQDETTSRSFKEDFKALCQKHGVSAVTVAVIPARTVHESYDHRFGSVFCGIIDEGQKFLDTDNAELLDKGMEAIGEQVSAINILAMLSKAAANAENGIPCQCERCKARRAAEEPKTETATEDTVTTPENA